MALFKIVIKFEKKLTSSGVLHQRNCINTVKNIPVVFIWEWGITMRPCFCAAVYPLLFVTGSFL